SALGLEYMTSLVSLTRAVALAGLCSTWGLAGAAQQRDTTAPPRPQDSLRVYTLPPAVVSVTRANPPINRIPQAVQLLDKTEISRARPTWGLDEALATVPGVYAANRYNFSLDQRISIRGFGARSAFAVRGIKVLVDGIPQTLPDGQGQLAKGWSLAATADLGWDPRADNPGALTAAEMARNPDSAAAINITRVAGKDVTQGQGGVTVRREFAGGGEASLTVFGIARSLKNPTTFAYIDLDRFDYGTRVAVSRPLPLGSLEHRLTAGIDFQRQRDDRKNFRNNAGQVDTTVRTLDQLEHVTEVGPF